MEMGLIKEIDFNNQKLIETLKHTVAAGLTDYEFIMFSELCKSSGLNPFKKEVWAIKAGGRLQLMTGINGFFSIANRNPQFDGIESGLIDASGEYKSAAYPKSDFIGAWSKVYRKDRKIPVESVAMLSEYKKNTPIWSQMTRVMITKCAESVALRKAFPQELNGLYTTEEMPPEYNAQSPKVIENEVIDIKTGEVYEIRYNVPFKDMAARQALKSKGFIFDKTSKEWIGSCEVAEAEKYRVGAAPIDDDDDDIPDEFKHEPDTDEDGPF